MPDTRIAEPRSNTLQRVRVRARNEVTATAKAQSGRRHSSTTGYRPHATRRVAAGRDRAGRPRELLSPLGVPHVSACCGGGCPRNPEGPSGAVRRPVGRVPGEGQSDGSCCRPRPLPLRDKNRCAHLTRPEGHCHQGQLSARCIIGQVSPAGATYATSRGQTHYTLGQPTADSGFTSRARAS